MSAHMSDVTEQPPTWLISGQHKTVESLRRVPIPPPPDSLISEPLTIPDPYTLGFLHGMLIITIGAVIVISAGILLFG